MAGPASFGPAHAPRPAPQVKPETPEAMPVWLIVLLFGFCILGFINPGAFLLISFCGAWLWIIGRTLGTLVWLLRTSLDKFNR